MNVNNDATFILFYLGSIHLFINPLVPEFFFS